MLIEGKGQAVVQKVLDIALEDGHRHVVALVDEQPIAARTLELFRDVRPKKLNALHPVRHRNKEGTQLFTSQVAACSMVCHAVCMAHYFIFRINLFII